MLKREDIEKKYKWSLEDIYPSWNEWTADVEKMKVIMGEIPKYKGEISKSSGKFIELVELDEKLSRLVDKIYLYPYLMKDLNSKDSVASEKLQEIEALYTQFGIVTAWITPEILTVPKTTMIKWIDENKEKLESHRFSLMETYRLQSHVLDENSEKLLSYYSQFNGSINDVYQELSTSDIKFNKIMLKDSNGKDKEEITVTNGAYSKIVSTDRIQENRKNAFEALYNSFEVNKNTYGAIYRGIVQRGVASAQAKNFGSSLERALEPKNISTEIYTTLLKSTKENVAPLRRYIELRKKYLNLEEYNYYDNSINIVNYEKEFDYEDAKKMVLDSVKPLGEDYTLNLSKALGDGWLDVYETENKRSGAYSINIYDVHPYMLLNYNGTLNSVYTLAHELGHTLHSMYSSKNQPYSTSSYTIFVAEVASTFNERLLLDNMLKKTTDSKEKIVLLEQALGNIMGTYYIQTLFADYEYQVHKLVEEGKPVTPDILSNIMANLFKEYFGETIKVDELQKIIWARIPHFFNSPYYVYQYATSFAASANIYDRVTNLKYSSKEREEATALYLTLLKSGGNDQPMNQLKKAGVDLSKEESFKAISTEFDRLLDVLEVELKKEFKK
ncbi:MAG: oligoendopeptidase F [Fusobacteriaceae bacterium]